ncbi:MAG: hypothetical protein K2H86_05315 [Muribaculaceae bacterium]|nr:hypothetical protein [Muribaculaceae bacterium]
MIVVNFNIAKSVRGCMVGAMALLSGVGAVAAPPVQSADCGRIERMSLYSPQMGDTITIDTWLPPMYYAGGSERYPVIYMHDGQNLYDAATTWNHQSWEMDSVMCALLTTGEIDPAIIVGIHSSAETRVADLMPEKAVSGSRALAETLEQVKLHGMTPRGDAYAAFMVETLKPVVDERYRTESDMRHTTVMGSSMGGLMSIYALCEYPAVFGNALCLSTHWIGAPSVSEEFTRAMYDYLEQTLPVAEPIDSEHGHRLYFDHGTETIDAWYGPSEERILELVRGKGYGEGTLLNIVDEGAAHEERSWARRVSIPLRYLLSR